MARKINPYNKLTTERFRQMGRYYWKCEYLNPFHIIKERDDLRAFRDRVLTYCKYITGSFLNTEEIKNHTDSLHRIAMNTQNNKYFAGEKQDMFGFVDYLCIDPIIGAVAVQVTSASGHAEHRRKILRNDYAARWAGFSYPIELWSWRKSPKVRGQKVMIWKPKVETITLDMFREFANASAGR